jgi:hypothetical protein
MRGVKSAYSEIDMLDVGFSFPFLCVA